MKHFVVVGGSEFQADLVRAAQNAGHQVLCVDANPVCYCFGLQGVISINVDILDTDLVLEALSGYQIVGAETVQSDIGVPLVSKIQDHFGLSKNRANAGQVFSNKFLFRRYLSDNGLTKHKPIAVNADNIDSLDIKNFPVVLKPVDSSGSRGVFKCEDISEVVNRVSETLKYSRSNSAIIEPWFSGDEFGAQVLIDANGRSSYIFHDDDLFKNIPVSHCKSIREIPSIITKTIDKIILDFNLSRCVLNVDFITSINAVEILEIGLRLGATELDKLVTHHIGKSIYDWILDYDKITLDNDSQVKSFGVLFNPFDYELEWRQEMPRTGTLMFHQYEVQYEVQANVKKIPCFTDGTKRFGRFEICTSLENFKTIEFMRHFASVFLRKGR